MTQRAVQREAFFRDDQECRKPSARREAMESETRVHHAAHEHRTMPSAQARRMG
jgi:hypothetical protein